MDINDTDENTLTDASRVTGRWKEPMDEEKRQNARVTEVTFGAGSSKD